MYSNTSIPYITLILSTSVQQHIRITGLSSSLGSGAGPRSLPRFGPGIHLLIQKTFRHLCFGQEEEYEAKEEPYEYGEWEEGELFELGDEDVGEEEADLGVEVEGSEW